METRSKYLDRPITWYMTAMLRRRLRAHAPVIDAASHVDHQKKSCVVFYFNQSINQSINFNLNSHKHVHVIPFPIVTVLHLAALRGLPESPHD